MSALVDHLVDYLTVRRALGYKLRQAEKLLGQFLDHLARGGAETITTEHALAWATLPAGHHAWHHLRLSIVRGFARYLKAIDSDTEVPAEELLPWRPCRAVPYIYTEEQITALIEAAEALRTSHRTATYQTLIGLLTATGMRIGEAISLDRADIGWQAGLLEIRAAKFGKSRELPLDPSAVEALRRYLRRRDRPPAAASTNAVLVSTVGTRLLSCGVEATFHRLVRRAGIEPRSACCRPRLHDLRYTFAVRTLLDGYREDGDPQSRLALLSTYLGNTDPKNTYWYRLFRFLCGSRPLRSAPSPAAGREEPPSPGRWWSMAAPASRVRCAGLMAALDPGASIDVGEVWATGGKRALERKLAWCSRAAGRSGSRGRRQATGDGILGGCETPTCTARWPGPLPRCRYPHESRMTPGTSRPFRS